MALSWIPSPDEFVDGDDLPGAQVLPKYDAHLFSSAASPTEPG
jgi:hypothetical protein